MNIKDILAKVAKSEPLTDAEKSFLAAYDHDKALNESAAAARREAEAKAAKALKAREDELIAERDKAKTEADAKTKEGQTESQKLQSSIDALTKQVTALTEAKDKAEKQSAAIARSQAIRDAAKAAGIVLAPKTVSEKLFFQMLEASLSGIDLTDETALKAALEAFKTENPGIIIAPGSGSGIKPGSPATSLTTGKNPWAKDSFNLTKQMELMRDNPELAKQLAAEAGETLA